MVRQVMSQCIHFYAYFQNISNATKKPRLTYILSFPTLQQFTLRHSELPSAEYQLVSNPSTTSPKCITLPPEFTTTHNLQLHRQSMRLHKPLPSLMHTALLSRPRISI